MIEKYFLILYLKHKLIYKIYGKHRRSFLKKVSAAGIGAAGLAMAGNAGATTTAAEPQKKKQPVKMMVNYVSVSSERVLDEHRSMYATYV